MTLRLSDRWLWDFWIATTPETHHVFYLQAPRSLGDPDLRHRNASVGHAVSSDLTSWEVLGDALLPGEPGQWDDRATWTGSVIEHNERWYMFYTGTCIEEGGRIQRIGLATSEDLFTWHKHSDEPLIVADSRWYETDGTSEWPEEAWRDPWITQIDGTFHALITARANRGPIDGRGVVGHATSTDLLDWAVQPPLSEPGEFAQLEVPQLVEIDGKPLLVFSCDQARISEQRRTRLGGAVRDAVYSVAADNPLGPYDIGEAAEALPEGLYSGRLVQQHDGSWEWLAFVDIVDGEFRGELCDPIRYPWTGQ